MLRTGQGVTAEYAERGTLAVALARTAPAITFVLEVAGRTHTAQNPPPSPWVPSEPLIAKTGTWPTALSTARRLPSSTSPFWPRIGQRAYGRWCHRCLAVPASMVGKTVVRWDLVDAGTGLALFEVAAAMYDRIRITNGGRTVLTLDGSGAAEPPRDDRSEPGSALSARLFRGPVHRLAPVLRTARSPKRAAYDALSAKFTVGGVYSTGTIDLYATLLGELRSTPSRFGKRAVRCRVMVNVHHAFTEAN